MTSSRPVQLPVAILSRFLGRRMTDDEVLALVQPALKRVPGGGYRQAPHDKTGLIVPRKDVRRLVEMGALLWVNRCRSAAVKSPGLGPRATVGDKGRHPGEAAYI